MSSCTDPCCFFCTMNEPNPSLRRSKLAHCFNQMPQKDQQSKNNNNDNTIILTLSSLWSLAMKQPNDPEFPSLGIFQCMSRLIQRALNDTAWLLSGQNIYIPYYAAHIIGSYTVKRPESAEIAAKASAVPPLIDLLKGKVTWVEKRVAVRALAHIACNESTFTAVAEYGHEVVELAMDTAVTCVGEVYEEFVGVKEAERVEYHCNLLTRGLGGYEVENAKAEEWACQARCWSLNLLSCFAWRERFLGLICGERGLLESLCGMWGGLGFRDWPCGVGLVRALCGTKSGRESLLGGNDFGQAIVESLCHVSRSSDDWQMMAIECLLLLLKDPQTRYKAIDFAVLGLGDLVELGRERVGEAIARVLLQDYHKVKYGDLRLSERTERALKEIWDLRVDRRKRERLMSEDEIAKKSSVAGQLKRQGNLNFRSGNVEKAVAKYSEGLSLCPLKKRKERIVLYSNRAQCRLVLGDADGAISDTTRALCLSARPHSKSLWRRAQAFCAKGLAREGLMDCMAFVKGRIECGNGKAKRGGIIPYYAARMINEQMNATWIFAPVVGSRRARGDSGERSRVLGESDGCRRDENLMIKIKSSPRCESTIVDPLVGKRWRRKKVQMAAGRCKKEHRRHCTTHVKNKS